MKLYPHLIVRDAPRALDYYVKALGAREVCRYVDGKRGGHVVHAELDVGGQKLTLSSEARDWGNDAAPSLGGSPVHMLWEVDDAHAAGRRMVEAGGEVVRPIEDQFYGERQGRIRDPFGHIWVITQHLEEKSAEEIQRGIDAWEPSSPAS
jgi:PhnB protein